VIDAIMNAAKVAASLVALIGLFAILWWAVGVAFGFGYLGFKFVTG
jgi:hypothetical protein